MVICYLGLGSNLGDRRSNIRHAIGKIKALKGTKVLKRSRIMETLPQGGPAGQPKFLNSAIKIQTNLKPLTLLRRLKSVERDMGRIRSVRNGPRLIDLDILFYGDKLINRRELKVPHLKVFKREFVVRPLLEIL